MEGFSFHARVQGYSHQLGGLECQDAASSCALPELGAHVFAVADGHGDPSCLRSAVGSAAAVEVACACLSEFAQEVALVEDSLRDAGTAQAMLDGLRTQVVTRWNARVSDHFAAHPLTQQEWNSLAERVKGITQERPAHLYGTTLVAGVALPHTLVLVQQGDGCCVVVHGDGTSVTPMPQDERCVGNVTTSLCDVDAVQSMRGAIVDLAPSSLMACVVGSDGVDKSLFGADGLLDFVDGLLLESLVVPAEDLFEDRLRESLASLSQWGSGDDASLAGFVDARAVARVAGTLLGRRERFKVEAELSQLHDKLLSMKRLYERYESQRPVTPEESRRRDDFVEDYERTATRVRQLEGMLDHDAVPARPLRQMQAKEPRASVSERRIPQVDEWAEEDEAPVKPQRAVAPVPVSRAGAEAADERGEGDLATQRILMVLVPLGAAVLGFALCLVLVLLGVIGVRQSEAPPGQQEEAAVAAPEEDEDSRNLTSTADGGQGGEEDGAGLSSEGVQDGSAPQDEYAEQGGTASQDEYAVQDGPAPENEYVAQDDSNEWGDEAW